jgi:hypothetical protein
VSATKKNFASISADFNFTLADDVTSQIMYRGPKNRWYFREHVVADAISNAIAGGACFLWQDENGEGAMGLVKVAGHRYLFDMDWTTEEGFDSAEILVDG